MADQKISELTALTGANVADDDAIAIVDTSATETKKIVFSELKNALDTATGFVRITGDTMTGDLSMGDNVKAIFGAGSDLLEIYRNSSGSYIKESGAGSLYIQGTDVRIQNATGENILNGTSNGAVTLYYDNAPKIATTATGVAITGGATFSGTSNFGDGNELRFGADNDLAIFHSGGVNNIRSDLGTLKLRSDDMRFTAQNGTSEFARFDSSGNFGIGSSAPGMLLEVDASNGSANDIARFSGRNSGGLTFRNATANEFILHTATSDALIFGTNGNNERLRIDSSGNVGIGSDSPDLKLDVSHNVSSEYVATFQNTADNLELKIGTTSGLLNIQGANASNNAAYNIALNAEGGNVGIGTPSPSVLLDARIGTTTGKVAELHNSVGYGIGFTVESDGGVNTINAESNQALAFATNGASNERMRIDSSGRVGIGATPNTNWRNDIADQEVLMLGTEATFFADSGVTTELWNNAYVDNDDVFKNISTRGASRYFQYEGAHKWFTAASASAGSNIGAEINSTPKMTLDVSGNLLVGMTTANTNNDGAGIRADGLIHGKRADVVATFNRKTSDGAVVEIAKDNLVAGSIGITGGDLDIGTGDTGIQFNDAANQLLPYNTSTRTTVDDAVGLGGATRRFTDLYLSGGVVFGSTGGSVTGKTLDDYEEGVSNPTLSGSTSGTKAGFGTYAKVGSLVLYQFTFNAIGSGLSGALTFGLPFTNQASNNTAQIYFPIQIYRGDWPATAKALYGSVNYNSTTVDLNWSVDDGVSLAVQGTDVDATGCYLRGTIMYRTDS